MARSSPLFLRFIILVLILKSTHAAFGFCIGMKGPIDLNNREVVAFRLWSDRGDQVSQHMHMFGDSSVKLEEDGWRFDLSFISPVFLMLTGVNVTSDIFGYYGVAPYEDICFNNSRYGSIYYGCFDDSQGYCEDNRSFQIQSCQNNFQLGNESIQCYL